MAGCEGTADKGAGQVRLYGNTRRSEVLEIYGGQRQGGISTPSGRPYIFLFTGESGKQYGYEDGWQSDEVYIFTGEGQTGDMTFTGGNRAIRDHQADGKDLHLFGLDPKRKGYARYMGQFLCIGHQWADGPDRERNTRRVIRFEMVLVASFQSQDLGSSTADEAEGEAQALSLDELRQRAKTDGATSGTTQERKRAAYRRSVWVKWYAWKRADGNCEGCGDPAPFLTPKNRPYLEVHHLHSMADGGPDLPEHVIAVCPTCHRRAHYAADSQEYNQRLIKIVDQKEPDTSK